MVDVTVKWMMFGPRVVLNRAGARTLRRALNILECYAQNGPVGVDEVAKEAADRLRLLLSHVDPPKGGDERT